MSGRDGTFDSFGVTISDNLGRNDLLGDGVVLQGKRGIYKNGCGLVFVVAVDGAALDKVGRRNAVVVSSELDLAATEVEVEDGDGVAVLVGDDEVLATRIELVVSGRLASCVEVANGGELTSVWARVLDTKDRDALVSSIRHNHETATLVDTDSSAGVHLGGEGPGNRADALDECEGRSSLESFHRFASLVGQGNLTEQSTVDAEDCHRRAQLVHDVGNIIRRVKLKIAWTVGLTRAETTGQHVELGLDDSIFFVKVELPDQVLSEAWDVCHNAKVWIQNEGMGMRVLLSHLDRRLIVVAVVDATILFGRRNDSLALFGIIHGSSRSGEFSSLG